MPETRASELLGREAIGSERRDAGEIVDLRMNLDARRMTQAVVELRDDYREALPRDRMARFVQLGSHMQTIREMRLALHYGHHRNAA